MTQDEIIWQNEVLEMAKQSGLIVNSPYLMPHYQELRGIEAFTKLVDAKATAREREACAELCEEYETNNDISATWLNIVAEAIRARAQADGGEQ